jgi:hypothetical protein
MNLFDFIKIHRDQPVDPIKEIRESYRRVFMNRDGQAVLTHILSELHFFDEVVEGNEVVLANFARRLLYFIGVWDSKNLEDQSLIQSFLRIPLKDEAGNPVERLGQGLDMIV